MYVLLCAGLCFFLGSFFPKLLHSQPGLDLCRFPFFVLRYEVSLGSTSLNSILKINAWSLTAPGVNSGIFESMSRTPWLNHWSWQSTAIYLHIGHLSRGCIFLWNLAVLWCQWHRLTDVKSISRLFLGRHCKTIWISSIGDSIVGAQCRVAGDPLNKITHMLHVWNILPTLTPSMSQT